MGGRAPGMAKLPADTTLTPFLSNSGSGTASFSDRILRVMASAIVTSPRSLPV